MKRFISFFSLIAIVATSVSAYDFMVNGLCFNKNADGTTVTVTYQRNTVPRYSSLSGALYIPPTVNYSGETYSVTSISQYAFQNCSGLTSVTIPNSVTKIGSSAFYDCINIETLNINSNSCASISYFYSSKTKVKTLVLGNSVTTIPYQAFCDCRGLLSLTIPGSVTQIGEKAFANCTDLDNIYSYPNPSEVTLGYDVFLEVPRYTCVLHVTPQHYEAYKKASQWKTFLNIVDDLAGVDGVVVDETTKEVEGYYNLQGVRLKEPIHGQVNIVRYTDGTTKKIVVK